MRFASNVSPVEVAEQIRAGCALRLIDVREPHEHAIARVEGAELIPIGALAGHLATLEHGDDIVVMCHHGIRSAAACAFLVREGFHHVRNMAGGIDRWSREVDASVPRY